MCIFFLNLLVQDTFFSHKFHTITLSYVSSIIKMSASEQFVNTNFTKNFQQHFYFFCSSVYFSPRLCRGPLKKYHQFHGAKLILDECICGRFGWQIRFKSKRHLKQIIPTISTSHTVDRNKFNRYIYALLPMSSAH